MIEGIVPRGAGIGPPLSGLALIAALDALNIMQPPPFPPFG
jgi:hypothetical protein